MNAVMKPRPLSQREIDETTNWALRMGAMKMNKDGSISHDRRYKRYSPEQLAQARALSRAKQFLADKKAAEIIQEARDAGCEGLPFKPDADVV